MTRYFKIIFADVFAISSEFNSLQGDEVKRYMD